MKGPGTCANRPGTWPTWIEADAIHTTCRDCGTAIAPAYWNSSFCEPCCQGGPTVRKRFWAFVDKRGPVPASRPELGQCWVWTGYTGDGRPRLGYGSFGIRRKIWRAHVLSYTWAYGDVPVGLILDHLCRNRACVNPDHLEPVTYRENLLRGLVPEVTRARFTARTSCVRGHPLTEDNIYRVNGRRRCRKCARIRNKARYEARKAAVKAGSLVPVLPGAACAAGHELSEATTYVTTDGYRRCRKCHRHEMQTWWASRRAARSVPEQLELFGP